MSNSYTRQFTALPEHIDVNGHVNNMVWLQWVQDLAGEHWQADAPAAYREDYVWFVIRHEIDYRGNVSLGDAVNAKTWIPDPPRGARFDRAVEFTDTAGKVLVSALSTWAMIEKDSGRLVRIRPEVAAPFFDD